MPTMLAVDVAVLIPIKAFHVAKARLSPVLDAGARERLARWTAERVVRAAAETPTYVACDDEQVATWAESRGATVLWSPGLGLNPAVDAAVETIRVGGAGHVIVSHADLPRPEALLSVARPGTVTLVPDRRLDGTNVRSFPLVDGVVEALPSSYGAGSFRRHLADATAHAIRHGIERGIEHGTGHGTVVEVIRHPDLSLDVDTPTDLDHPLVRGLVAGIVSPAAAPHRS